MSEAIDRAVDDLVGEGKELKHGFITLSQYKANCKRILTKLPEQLAREKPTAKEYLVSKGIHSLDTKKRTVEVLRWMEEYAALKPK